MPGSRIQGKHAGLSREQVLEAAVDLIDAEGVEALSMRRLARELGVEAMSLYHHVRNKGELEDAVVEYVLTQSRWDRTYAASWQEALTEYALALHRGLRAHPGVAPLVATRPGFTARNLADLEELLARLIEAGFPVRTALAVVHATAGCVLGQFVVVRQGPREPSEPAADAGPLVTRALEAGVPDSDALLAFTLKALIAGYESLL